jgi:hypothetical protein
MDLTSDNDNTKNKYNNCSEMCCPDCGLIGHVIVCKCEKPYCSMCDGKTCSTCRHIEHQYIKYKEYNKENKHTKYKKHICEHLNEKEGKAWLWEDIPYEHLIESGLVDNDNQHLLERNIYIGETFINPLPYMYIDIVLLDNNKYILISCFNKNKVVSQDTGGMFSVTCNMKNVECRIYHTKQLSIEITDDYINDNVSYVKKIF